MGVRRAIAHTKWMNLHYNCSFSQINFSCSLGQHAFMLLFDSSFGRLRHFHSKFNMPFLNKRWVISQLKHPTQRWIGFWWIINKDPFQQAAWACTEKVNVRLAAKFMRKTMAQLLCCLFLEMINYSQLSNVIPEQTHGKLPKIRPRKNIITAVRSFIVLLVFCHISLDNLMFCEPSLPVSCPIHQSPFTATCDARLLIR